MQIEYSRRFIKNFKKCPKYIQEKFSERLELFLVNRSAEILNEHCLSRKLIGFKSINISGDYRAIFEVIDKKDVIYFITIGTHSQLYK